MNDAKDALKDLEEGMCEILETMRKEKEELGKDECFWEVLSSQDGEWRLMATVYDKRMFGSPVPDMDPGYREQREDRMYQWSGIDSKSKFYVRQVKLRTDRVKS